MSDTAHPATLDTSAPEIRRERFESAWRAWRAGEEPPRWESFLPGPDEPCDPDLVFFLVQLDIECRAKAGLPALLAERYFEHPRLQREDARLDIGQQVELIRWEYQQRWKNGASARREDYQAAFPQHADALRELKPRSRCPRCQKMIELEETWQTVCCPHCAADTSLSANSPPFVAESPPSADAALTLDARCYELIEPLGKGGMGEVYRSSDPALERDLAIKVMKSELRGHAEAERRFLREARVTGSLQHPGIVAVHNLGRLADGRLHYTMKLVRGRTFADILREEAGHPEHLPSLLVIFEKICQAVAYAHSKRVIHRDLKPANVMVGRFGEVQVMDWGLAKLLGGDDGPAAPEEQPDAAGTRIRTEAADTPSDLSRTGAAFGTPAYMSPEQAAGDWEVVDERADVFALGAILCEMLTGAPAYKGHDGNEVLRRARRGDLAEVLERLERCGEDAALTALCRECLSPGREGRPRDAGIVAQRVAEYQADVQERLRQAELERVAAEARAQEEQARATVEQERTREALARVAAERRARQRTLALAAAVLVLLAGVAAAAWRIQRERAAARSRQDEADREVLAVLERAGERLDEAWQQHDLTKLEEVKAEAERAAVIARSGGSEAVGQRVADFRAKAQERLDRAKRNNDLLNALLDVSTPHETKTYKADESGRMMLALAQPSVDEQYAAAFRRRWPDVDIEKEAASAVAARLREEPEAVLEGVIAGLDAWMLERRWQKKHSEEEWRCLLRLVERLDQSEQRRQLRALLIGAAPPRVEDVVGLLGGRSPWPALWELARGNEWRRLQQLRSQLNAIAEPVLTVLLLTRASIRVGDIAGAEAVLRQTLARRPDEVALLDALGKVLGQQGRSRLAEAIGCYRAARAKRPELGIALGRALGQAGHAAEGEAVLRDLLRQQPKNPEMLIHLGLILYDQRRYAEAEAAYRKAVVLKPDYAEAYGNLGVALCGQRKYVDAEAACRKAIALKPDLAGAHSNFGGVLSFQGKHAEAETVLRKAVALQPDDVQAYSNLGAALGSQKKYAEADAALRKAIALKPDYAKAYVNLGATMNGQGKYTEAETVFRKAIALQPDDVEAYGNLGRVLYDQRRYAEAEAAYRKAIVLKPDYAEAYGDLGGVLRNQGRFTESLAAYRRSHKLGSKQPGWRNQSLQWVREAERLVELEKKLPAILQGESSPTNPGEAVLFAQMCQQPYKKQYAASARLYADAFAADPKLAADLQRRHRYNAACSAAPASAGQGEGARLLPDKVVVMFRHWALGWLRDDLTAYAKLAERNNPDANKMIQQRLAHWQSDSDLASVRDPQALDRLPDNERAAWQALWRDADELAKRVANRDKAGESRR